jgi:hypothetical protein
MLRDYPATALYVILDHAIYDCRACRRCMVQSQLKLSIMAIIRAAQEAGVLLAAHGDCHTSRIGFHLYSTHGFSRGAYGVSVYLHTQDLLLLSTEESLERIFSGLGILTTLSLPPTTSSNPGPWALPVPSDPGTCSLPDPGMLDVTLFRPYEVALLKLLAWEVEQGRRDAHGVEDPESSVELE